MVRLYGEWLQRGPNIGLGRQDSTGPFVADLLTLRRVAPTAFDLADGAGDFAVEFDGCLRGTVFGIADHDLLSVLVRIYGERLSDNQDFSGRAGRVAIHACASAEVSAAARSLEQPIAKRRAIEEAADWYCAESGCLGFHDHPRNLRCRRA